MLLQKPLKVFILSLIKQWKNNKFYKHHNKTDQKYKDGDAVHTMHVFCKIGAWCVWIAFFDVEIFAYLPPDTHKIFFTKLTINMHFSSKTPVENRCLFLV